MDKVTIKIDTDGNLTLPEEVLKELGNNLILKKTPKGYLLTSKQFIANKKLKELLNSPPKRKGAPKLATPQEMKSIWKEIKKETVDQK